MDKRGQGMFFVVKRFMIVVSLIILLVVTYLVIDAFTGKTDDEICKTTVALQHATSVNVGPIEGPDSPLDPHCKTHNIVFYNDHVEKDNKKHRFFYDDKFVNDFDNLNDDIVNSVVARAVADCWDMFGQGKIAVFDLKTKDLNNNNKACFPCAEITFAPEPALQEKTFSGLYDFMKQTDYKSGMTFYDFIANNDRLCVHYLLSPGICWENYLDAANYQYIAISITGKPYEVNEEADRLPIERNTIFDTSKSYTVFFVKLGQERSDTTMFSYVVESDKLGDQCDMPIS
jgi:hypothetical protein